jgi:glycosyltransferase involved in cell wall biosynthesis
MPDVDQSKSDRDVISILAVIVLYKTRPNESTAFRTLEAAWSGLGHRQNGVRVLLYDNTPGGCDPGSLPENVRYEAAEQNVGLAAAYNRALEIARSEGCNWLLTLDQDTSVPVEFLSRMSVLAAECGKDDRVAAIVPRLSDGGRPLSPVFIGLFGVSYLRHSFKGVARRETHAYNSASLFRVSALKQIGGFNCYFWLDYLDASVYHQFHKHGRKVYIAGDIQVEHQLSLLHGEDLKADRYRNFLQAETAFCDLYRGRITGLALTLRLFARILRQRMRGDNPAIRKLTWNAFKKRIVQSKTRRIQDWRKEMEQRMVCCPDAETGPELSEERPAISVCMAAYNGERYITAQLQSILSQLTAEDEVIVVDDASTDRTRECVRSLQDKRIKLIEHSRNSGVSHTFEDAIRGASNGILFLSDQDDLWDPRKAAVILDAFRTHPDVTLIATDTAIIRADGSLVTESYFKPRGKFRPGLWANLVRNRFGGCTMAFRSTLIGEILPLPHEYDVLHDIWIGVRNSLAGYRTLYIPESLVLNRRHSSTATGKKALTIFCKVRIRVHLLLALAEFSIARIEWNLCKCFEEGKK